MKFYSTNGQSEAVSFKEAVIKSLPSDRGLYFPEEIPELDYLFLETLDYYSLPEIGMEVLRQFTKDDIPEQKLSEILHEALDFEIPVKEVEKNIHTLELFHGPTYAFKDVGARFLARCLGYFNETESKEVTILVATSGDTGGAVASGFYNVPGVNVVILYPYGKVSDLQEKQLTTLGGNIKALEVEGDFDACQAMVKKAFLDSDINSKLNLSSANSINIARWLPQSIYFFEAYKQLKDKKKVVFAVPSGNYGNITAGMLAKKMGLDIHRFIAASNANDTVPRYLRDGQYEVRPTVQTLSNAMDVSDPSNHPRMLELHEKNFKDIIKHTEGFTLTDEQTLDVMKSCYASNQYILDPHGAIGYQSLKEQLQKKETGVFLETAHYCKFLSTVEQALDQQVDLPDFVADLMTKEKVATQIPGDYEAFKEYLLS
ncbi:threonine synthase [Marinoscillum sp.]|uniref:threonine synthase n=1 Tax=Marinoscillum sp. TaxID=2024838 RepID=UPI003BA95DA9